MKIIDDVNFFKSDTVSLAKNLIGKWIVTNVDNKVLKAQICETEAYIGINDSACHTYNSKRTARTEPMWMQGGTIYVYVCYGLHYMFNIVSKSKGEPEAVLIRGVVGAVGPAKLTKLLNIDKSFNGQSIVNNPNICIMDDGKNYKFTKAKRVGINYAKVKDRNALLRFILK